MDKQLALLVAQSVKNMYMDSYWQSLGFDKFPKPGGFFSRKPEWKKKLENRIALHITYTSLALMLKFENLTSEQTIREAVDILNAIPLQNIVFEDAFECINFYANNPTTDWSNCMQVELFKLIPDENFKTQLSSGIALFCAQSTNALEDMTDRFG
jgi:hypothetical protein